jgi:hypothetical protein
MSFEVEVEINGDGLKASSKRIISLAMLCVRPGMGGIRKVAVNESRMGIWWGINKLIKPEEVYATSDGWVEAREIKTVDVRVIAEPHTEGDICKKGKIEFDPPLRYVFSPLAKNRTGYKELDEKVWALAESVTGGLIDFLTTYGTVLEYYEDGKVKCHLVQDVDEVPDKVTKNRRDYKKELEEVK